MRKKLEVIGDTLQMNARKGIVQKISMTIDEFYRIYDSDG